MVNPSRRLEDRIRELCLQVAQAKNLNFREAISELQTALNAFAQLQMALDDVKRRVEDNTSTTVLWPEFPRDRRGESR